MKRYFAILFVAFMLVGMGLSADESVLIDFAQLVADYPKERCGRIQLYG
jgi:predicted RND superfamily exporter protein